MNREKKLFKNTIIITIGKICTQLITFLLLPLYTSILTTEEYGIVDLLNTLVALILPIATFQVEKAVFRELVEVRNDHAKKKVIISNGFFSIIAQCGIYLSIFFLIYPIIKNQFKLFLATNVLANIFSSLFLQIARGLGDNKKYALGSFISAFATIFFNIVFLVVIKLGVYGMLLGTLLGQITCILYLFITLKIYKYLKIKLVQKEIIQKLWKYSIPLIPNAISWWIFNVSDRVIVSGILGLSTTGILSAASKFSSVYITLYNIFNMSWTESVVLNINDKDFENYFNKIFNSTLNLFISLALGIISLMPFIYPILINIKFSEGYFLIPILITASILNVFVGLISTIYVAKKNTKAIANTSIISAIINILVHLTLIKYIGLYAAAISTLISFLIMALYRFHDIKKKYYKIEIKKSLLIYTTIIIFSLISYYINNIKLNIITLLIVFIYTIMSNKNTLHIILETIKKKIKTK